MPRIWRTRTKGTKKQVGKKFVVDGESRQTKVESLPRVSPRVGRVGVPKKIVYAVPCMDETGAYVDFAVLASSEDQAKRKAAKRGLVPMSSSPELKVVEGRPKSKGWKERIKEKIDKTLEDKPKEEDEDG